MAISITQISTREVWAMRKLWIALLCVVFLGAAFQNAFAEKYEPNWESLDARPLPEWFDEAKFGIFIHWGVYSVPAWGPKGKYAEWYWHYMSDPKYPTHQYHIDTYGKDFKYADFAAQFDCRMFDPEHWAKIFNESGAKYVVLTSKHHEGYTLWPSAESWNWNSVDVGPGRDLCGELTKAVKDAGLKMGFYYSLYEWYNPVYNNDVAKYVDQHMIPQMKDLVTRYHPDILWPDGQWGHPDTTWRSTEFLAWLYNESVVKDTIIVNDRWGKKCRGSHGGFYTTEYGRGASGTGLAEQRKWEECRGIGKSFGYNRNETIEDYSTKKELIRLLITTVSKGGNLLLDIGPTSDGRIPVIMEQRLLEIGEWLKINGGAIYGTAPANLAEPEWGAYTKKPGKLFLHIFDAPGARIVIPDLQARVKNVCLTERPDKNLEVNQHDGNTTIHLPESLPDDNATVVVVEVEE